MMTELLDMAIWLVWRALVAVLTMAAIKEVQ